MACDCVKKCVNTTAGATQHSVCTFYSTPRRHRQHAKKRAHRLYMSVTKCICIMAGFGFFFSSDAVHAGSKHCSTHSMCCVHKVQQEQLPHAFCWRAFKHCASLNIHRSHGKSRSSSAHLVLMIKKQRLNYKVKLVTDCTKSWWAGLAPVG